MDGHTPPTSIEHVVEDVIEDVKVVAEFLEKVVDFIIGPPDNSDTYAQPLTLTVTLG